MLHSELAFVFFSHQNQLDSHPDSETHTQQHVPNCDKHSAINALNNAQHTLNAPQTTTIPSATANSTKAQTPPSPKMCKHQVTRTVDGHYYSSYIVSITCSGVS